MSKSEHRIDPTLSPGADPSIHATSVEHRAALERLAATVLRRATPAFMPGPEHLLRQWVSSFLSVAAAARLTYPTVLNSSTDWRFNLHTVNNLWAVYLEYVAALEVVTPFQRFLTQTKNSILFAAPERIELPPPRNVPELYPKSTAAHVGVVGLIAGMAEALLALPNFTEAEARKFGFLPQPEAPVDPATLDPNATARFTGGEVIISLRSPRSIRGVDFAEIRCDRMDGAGIQPVGMTVSGRFIDHHDTPPAAGRANWVYYVRFVDSGGRTVGRESVTDVTVQGIA